MIIQPRHRGSVEFADAVVENAAGATITLGFPACLTTTAASVDGKKAVLPAAANFLSLVGPAVANIPDTDFGRVRVFGYFSSVRIYAHGTSVTIAAGVALGTGPGSSGYSSTGLLESYGPVISMESIGAAVCSPGGYAKGFCRNM